MGQGGVLARHTRTKGSAPKVADAFRTPRHFDVPDDVSALLAYVPRMLAEWLEHDPETRYRSVPGTCVFADISGFTNLTERLARNGKAGAEEMGDLLNSTFEELLTAAYDYGANLIKWGGDAVLLLFDGDGHVDRAAEASWAMQDVMRQIGKLKTSCGVVRLGMSIGIHTGEFDMILAGTHYRELIVTGPGASETARMEKIAERGQIVISTATKEALPSHCRTTAAGTGWRLTRPPGAAWAPNRTRKNASDSLLDLFCPQLGEHLASGAVDHEHRQITVGFIEFSGTDELLAKEGPEALTDAVEYVVRATQDAAADNDVTILSSDLCEDGGKLIVVSGAPKTTGDDEARVLSTVRRVVHPGGRLSLRAGVNSGAVFAGDYGTFYRRVYSITGDCVNLAARLMGKAQPGQIIAMPTVVERSRAKFETAEIPPFAVKGKADLIEALLIGDPSREPTSRRGDRLPLIGRDEELTQILEALSKTTAGQGSVFELVGPAGMGKSRLIEEVVERSGARPLWADGDIYAGSTPYQPLHRLLRHTLGLPDDVEDEKLAAVVTDLIVGSAPDLIPMLPLIGVVAGVDFPTTPEIEALEPKVRRARVEEVTSGLLGRLLTMPVVMIFNDLYLMDDASIDFIKRLAADVGDRPWVIIATRRPDSTSPFDDSFDVTRITLGPLDVEAATELLITANASSPLPSHRIRQLAERAGGNPLYLRELIAGVEAGANADDLPDSLDGVIAMRIDKLPPIGRRWLRSAAVLGMTVDPELLAAVLTDEQVTRESLATLDEFLLEGADGQWRFMHHLVRTAAYEGMPYRQRTQLHGELAEILEVRARGREEQMADLLAIHCFYGGRFEGAWHYGRTAGARARAHYALTEAVEHYTRALSAADELPEVADQEVAETDEALAFVYVDLGEFDAADRVLAHGRRRARDDVLVLASLQMATATVREQSGRYNDALRWVTNCRSTLVGRNDPESLVVLARASNFAATARYRQGKFKAAIRWSVRAAAEAQEAGDRVNEARALEIGAICSAYLGLPWSDSSFEYAIGVYEEIGDLAAKAVAYNRYGACAYFAGRWDDAVDLYVRAEQTYWRTGVEHGAALNAANRAEVLIQQGHVDGVDEILDAATRVWQSTKSTSMVAFGLMLRGRADLARGDYSRALEHLKESRELSETLGETDEIATIDGLRALAHLRCGEVEEALEIVVAALADDVATGGPATPMLERVRGEALIASGAMAVGYEALRASLDDARRRDAEHEVAETLEALLRLDAPRTPAEDSTWRDERARLVKSLGLADLAAPSK